MGCDCRNTRSVCGPTSFADGSSAEGIPTSKLNRCGSGRGLRRLPKPGRGSISRNKVTRNLSLDHVGHYASRYQGTVSLGNKHYSAVQRTCPSPFKLQRRTVGGPFSLVAALRFDRAPGQIHVVRSLISDNPTVVNSVDVVRWFAGSSVNLAHLLFHRMAGLHCIGPRSPAHLISPSTSSSRRRR